MWTYGARWSRDSSRSRELSSATSNSAANGERPSPSTGTAARSWTCGPVRETSTAPNPGPWTPSRSSAPPGRVSPPPCRCCCTSADRSTWTPRSARTGRSSRRTGKERVLVRHLLAHRAGLAALDRALTPQEAADGATGAAAVAAQRPQWEPGTDHGYHAQTYSWLVGELVRRVTGRTIGRWVAEEIARPLGLDFWFGLPADEAHRIGPDRPRRARRGRARRCTAHAPKRSVVDAYADPASLTRRAFGAIDPFPDENDPAYRAAELPASNGVATARGLARFYAAMIGQVDGDAAVRARHPHPGPHRGVRGAGPCAGRQHPLRPRLHAARPGGAAARPGVVRAPRPRRFAGLRRPRNGHSARLCDERPAEGGYRRSPCPGPGPGSSGRRCR